MLEFAKDTLVWATHGSLLRGTTVVGKKTGHGNWVTEGDIGIERFVTQALAERFPNHVVLAEETARDEHTMHTADMWVLDPLDGTTNFVLGVPHYAISLAFLHDGEVALGVIFDIPHQTMYWAERGKGAYAQQLSGAEPRQLRVRQGRLAESLVGTGSPYERRDFVPNWILMDRAHSAGARIIILGSAAIALCYAAEGKVSLYYERGLKPWDVAAGSLIVQEAGGVVRCVEGEFELFHPRTIACGGQIAVEEFLALAQESSE